MESKRISCRRGSRCMWRGWVDRTKKDFVLCFKLFRSICAKINNPRPCTLPLTQIYVWEATFVFFCNRSQRVPASHLCSEFLSKGCTLERDNIVSSFGSAITPTVFLNFSPEKRVAFLLRWFFLDEFSFWRQFWRHSCGKWQFHGQRAWSMIFNSG